MFQKLLTFIGFIFLAALLTPSSPNAHAQRENLSEAPYIYYYSSYHEAFVIERADGTDTRLLGQGLHPPTFSVGGAGWSPSGEWFGWVSYIQGAYSSDNHEAWVLRSDGSSRLHSTDGFEARFLSWSPVDDLLMLADSKAPHGYIYHLYLIDPNTDSIIASYEPPESVYQMRFPVWHPDGQGVAFYEMYEGEYGRLTRSYTLMLNGELIEHGGRGVGEWDSPTFTADGRLIGLAGNQLHLSALEREHNSSIRLPSSDIRIVSRSRDRNWVTLLSCMDCTINRHGLWLLNFSTLELRLIDEYVLGNVSWSSTDSRFVLYTQLPQQQILYDVVTGEHHPLPSLSQSEGWYGWLWLNDGRLAAFLRSEEHPCLLFLYLPAEQPLMADISYHCWEDLQFSPDGRFELTTNFSYRSTLYDRESGEQMTINPHSAKSGNSGMGSTIYWHPSSEWAIVVENNCVAGGCGGSDSLWRMIGSDGSYRDINHCTGGLCLSWLPSRVNLEQLPPALEQVRGRLTPVQTMQTAGWVTQLSWSPDSQFLASGWGIAHWETPSRWADVWRVDGGEHVHDFGVDGRNTNLTWESDELGAYQAVISPPQAMQGHRATISPNQRYFVRRDSSVYDGPFLVYEFSSEDLLYTLTKHTEFVYQGCFDFSSDERWLAGGGHAAGRLQFWEAETGEHSMDFDLFACGVAFSPDGLWLAVGVGWDIHIYAMADIEAALLAEE